MNGREDRLPQPAEIDAKERDDAMGAYLMMFAAWAIGLPFPMLNLIAALIYFLINKRTSRFVAFHAYQSLITQFPVTAVNVTTVVWLIRILITDLDFSSRFFGFLLFAVVWNLLYVGLSIVAMTRAHHGEFFYFPIFGRIAFARYFWPNSAPLEGRDSSNHPPSGF